MLRGAAPAGEEWGWMVAILLILMWVERGGGEED